MKPETTLRQLTDLVRKFCEERAWDEFHGAKDLAIGVSTEAAELLEHFRFRSEPEITAMLQDEHARTAIAAEMSDVLYFLLRLADRYQFDLAEEFARKMRVNERRYPVQASKGTNKKYTEL